MISSLSSCVPTAVFIKILNIFFLHERTFILTSFFVKRNVIIASIGYYGALQINIIIIIITHRKVHDPVNDLTASVLVLVHNVQFDDEFVPRLAKPEVHLATDTATVTHDTNT